MEGNLNKHPIPILDMKVDVIIFSGCHLLAYTQCVLYKKKVRSFKLKSKVTL